MSSPRVVALIQARLTSSRLPNKVLAKIGPWTVIELMYRRLRRADRLNDIVFVIPDTIENDPLNLYLESVLKVQVFRGSELDVLKRFAGAKRQFPADYYVRLTADCPLICPELVNEVICCAVSDKLAYATNTNPPTFPDGFDVECISQEALQWTDENTSNLHWREHVTYGLREGADRPKSFKFGNVTQKDMNGEWIRLTLDTPGDLDVFREMHKLKGDVLEKLDHKDLQRTYMEHDLGRYNSSQKRNEGFSLSQGLHK